MASGPRCGDNAKFEFKVSSELVGKYATTLVARTKKHNITAMHAAKLEKTATVEVRWPDLEIKGLEGMFYGGRQVDFAGLNKLSYKEKFAHQRFMLKLYQGRRLRESSDAELQIDPYPDVAQEHKRIGINVPVKKWEQVPIKEVKSGKTIGHLYSKIKEYAKATTKLKNCGNFWIELKDGVVIITVKMKLTNASDGKPAEDKVFDYIKKRAEAFWNSDSTGFNQWVYHRHGNDGCQRESACNCSLGFQKGEFTTAGCCKVPMRLHIEKGSDVVVKVESLNPKQIEEASRNYLGLGSGASGTRANTGKVYFPENRTGTYAHELGHMMGFPDQYKTGHVDAGAMSASGPTGGGAFPIDPSSIMGSNHTTAKKIHAGAEWFHKWIEKNLNDPFKLIDK